MPNRSAASLAMRLLQGALLLLPLFLFASCATPQSDPSRPSSHHSALPDWLAPKMDPDDRIFYHDALIGR